MLLFKKSKNTGPTPVYYNLFGACFCVWEYGDRVEFICGYYGDHESQPISPTTSHVFITKLAVAAFKYIPDTRELLNKPSGGIALLNDLQFGRAQYLLNCAHNEDDGRLRFEQNCKLLFGCVTFTCSREGVVDAKLPSSDTWMLILLNFAKDLAEKLPPMAKVIDVESFRKQVNVDSIDWHDIGTKSFSLFLRGLHSSGSGQAVGNGSLILANRDKGISGFSPFSYDTNPHVFMSFGAGGGSWNFSRALLIEHLHSNGGLVVFDTGMSYKSLCERLGGDHIMLQPSGMSINPFPFMYQNKELYDYEQEVKNIFRLLVPDGVMQNRLDQLTILDAAVSEEVERGGEISLARVYKKIKKKHRALRQALYPFAKGNYKHLFEGVPDISFNGDFTVFEFEELKAFPEMKSIVAGVLTTLTFIHFSVHSTQKKKMIFYGELWDLWDGSDTAHYECVIRRSRMKNVSIVGLTCSVADVLINPTIRMFWDNSGFKTIGYQKPESWDHVRETLSISDNFIELARGCKADRQKKVVDFLLCRVGFCSKMTYIRDPFTDILLCSDPKVVAENRACYSTPMTQEGLASLIQRLAVGL